MIDGVLTDPADPFSMIVRKMASNQIEATNRIIIADMTADLRKAGFSGGIAQGRRILTECGYERGGIDELAMSAMVAAPMPGRLSV